MRVFSVFAFLCFVAQTGSANAAVILDQFHSPQITSVVQARSYDYQGQTFTVGVDGKLDSIRLAMGNYQVPPEIEAQFYLAPIFENVALFSQAVSLNIPSTIIPPNGDFSFGTWVTLDFSAFNIQVAAGDEYALVFHSSIPFEETGGPSAKQINWFAGNPGTYAFGTPIGINPFQDTPIVVRNDFDHAFATYVSTVPEPSTWALLILGFGMVGFSLRRQRRKAIRFYSDRLVPIRNT